MIPSIALAQTGRGGSVAAVTGDPLRSYVISLCLGEGADGGTVFDDDVSANPDLTPDGLVTTSTTVAPPFGASSVLFPGTIGDSYLAATPVANWIGDQAGDSTLYDTAWCIDDWIYPTSIATRIQCIGGDDYGSLGHWNAYLLVGTDGSLTLAARGGGGVSSAAGVIVQGVWSHVAICGPGGSGAYKIYVNSSLVATAAGASYTKQNNGNWHWGEHNVNFGGFARNFIGRMKCMRITWGHQRFAGAGFTLPTSLSDYA